MRSPEAMVQLFRERGLKVTPQREWIFTLLHGSETHPTAESVYAAARTRMPTMSLKTVYQTLNDLAAMGELQVLEFGTGSNRFDPNVGPHHHLVCTSCGKVRDVHADFADLRLPDGEAQGFSVGSADVVFRGRCADCPAEVPPTPPPNQQESTNHG